MTLLADDVFAKCSDKAGVFTVFRAHCVRAGVQLMSIIAPLPFQSVTSPGTYIQFWGYDPQWQAEYLASGWDESGRIEDQILEYGGPILWRDLESMVNLSAANRTILALFFQYHGRLGICMPIFGHYAFQTLLSFSLEGGITRLDDPRVAAIAQLASLAQRRYIDLSRLELRPVMPLSAREQEVIQQMASGRSKKVTADKLGISASSVDTYLRRIFAKLNVNDRTAAVVRSLALGLVKL